MNKHVPSGRKIEKMSTAVADWPKFHARLEDRQEVSERTMAFRFEKPASFEFTPGQFIDITLLNLPWMATTSASKSLWATSKARFGSRCANSFSAPSDESGQDNAVKVVSLAFQEYSALMNDLDQYTIL